MLGVGGLGLDGEVLGRPEGLNSSNAKPGRVVVGQLPGSRVGTVSDGLIEQMNGRWEMTEAGMING